MEFNELIIICECYDNMVYKGKQHKISVFQCMNKACNKTVHVRVKDEFDYKLEAIHNFHESRGDE